MSDPGFPATLMVCVTKGGRVRRGEEGALSVSAYVSMCACVRVCVCVCARVCKYVCDGWLV